MSYEVLARKWRPLTFDDVVGQDHITRTLKRAVETARISHAYMFSGPRGCGKTSTARILARVINCQNLPGDGNPCNECASCQAVIRGNNLDVMEIDGASHTGVAEVRDLQESIGYSPSQYKSKVYIIDEVHMLSTHAFNALLKTLEEPPSHVYFVFATTAPQKIPDTIKSRCQRHHFKRLEIKEIAKQLEMICESENFTSEKEGLRLLAGKADGSMRDGTSLLDQCVTSSGGNVTAEAVRNILGLIDQEKIQAFMDSIADGDPTAALKLLDGCIDEGLDIQELSAALLEGYRDLMMLAAPGDLSDLVLRSADEIGMLKKLLPKYELPDLVTVVERLCEATPRLKNAADPRIWLESLLVDLALLDRQVDIRSLISDLEGSGGSQGNAPERGQKKTGPTDRAKTSARGTGADAPSGRSGSASVKRGESEDWPVGGQKRRGRGEPLGDSENIGAVSAEKNDLPPEASSRRAAQSTAGDGELDLVKLGELWDGFVTFVRQKKVSLGVCLISGKLHAFDGRTVTLRFLKSFNLQKEQVSNAGSVRFLKQMLKKYFGKSLDIKCVFDGEERVETTPDAAQPPPTQPDARALRGVSDEKMPIVEKIIKEFNGEIIRHNR